MLFKIILTGLFAISALLFFATFYAVFNLPSIDELVDIKYQEPMQIFDRNNKLIGLYGEKFRKPVTLSQLPDYVPKAFLASEDARFYNHNGIDFISLARAIVALVVTREKNQGGSTITMQVARNFYLTRKKTFTRKFIEILLALKMEQNLSKDKILELYLNKIFFGYRAYGIAAASRVYFGKNPEDLTVGEAAMLAGLPQRPSLNNPITNPLAALNRRNNYVLPRMHELGWISQEEMEKAKLEEVNTSYHGVILTSEAGYLSEAVRQQLINILPEDFVNEGYKIYTTIDSRLQNMANKALREGLIRYSYKRGIDFKQIEQLEKPLEYYDPLDLERHFKSLKSYGNLMPAVVLSSNRNTAKIYFSPSRVDVLSIKDISWARERLENNNYGPVPKRMSDLVSPGSIIWGFVDENDRFVMAQKPPAEGSFVVQNPHTGEILVMVGGYDHRVSKFNRATQINRQMGSIFKPLLYTIALENGYTSSTLVEDAPLVIYDSSLEGSWRPDNYAGKFKGRMRLRSALVQSRNLVSIRLLKDMTINVVRQSLKRFGLSTKKQVPPNLSMALGSGNSNPLMVNNIYASFANGGYKVTPWFINKVVDNNGITVYHQPYQAGCSVCFKINPEEEVKTIDMDKDDHSYPLPKENQLYRVSLPNVGKEIKIDTQDIFDKYADITKTTRLIVYNQRIIDPRLIFIMNDILHDVTRNGTAARVGVNIPKEYWAGKTGTTNESKDSWFMGFNRHMVATVWVGNDNYKSLGRNETGSSLALPIWIDFMIASQKLRKQHLLNEINFAYPELYMKEAKENAAAADNAATKSNGAAVDDVDIERPLKTIPEWVIELEIDKKNGSVADKTIIKKLTADSNQPLITPLSDTINRNIPIDRLVKEYFILENINSYSENKSASDLFR